MRRDPLLSLVLLIVSAMLVVVSVTLIIVAS
jgi:hypothetical protein